MKPEDYHCRETDPMRCAYPHCPCMSTSPERPDSTTSREVAKIVGTFAVVALLLFAPRLAQQLEAYIAPTPNAATVALAQLQIVKPISDAAAVALIMRMNPTRLPTPSGDAAVTRGSEIYIAVPDSLRAALRLTPRTYLSARCVEITPAAYGWRVVAVHTRQKCRGL